MNSKIGNGAIAGLRGATNKNQTNDLNSTLQVAGLLGTPAGLGTLRALEPRVLLDAAVMATLAETADTQSHEDAQAWRIAATPAIAPYCAFDQRPICDLPPPNPETDLQIGNVEPTSAGGEVVFIDSAVADIQPILDAISTDAEVIFLDANRDGLTQIADILSNRTEISAIHIISHGEAGSLQLGNASLNSDSIAGEHADELAIVRSAMSANGDILIYGCDFGAGDIGLAAVDDLALATGADIAASDDLTGAANFDGDWDLEVETGSVEAYALSPLAWVGTLDLTITDAGTAGATGLAQAILGDGVTINSATYSGTSNQAGTFVTGAGASFGSNILTFTDGAIFSSGTAASVAGPNNFTGFTVNAPGGIDGDADFNALAGGATFDASFIEINFTPDVPAGASIGDTGRMTMEIVFGSEEYNEFVYGGVNDTLAVIVNGVNQAAVPNGLAIGIDTINDAGNFNPGFGNVANDPNPEHTSAIFESANPSLYVNNTAFNTQMDGFTITIPVTFDVIVGQANTIKLGIADTADTSLDSWMFVRADSGQTVIVAENDSVTTPTNVPFVIDVTANDYDLQGDPLTVTHILGQAVSVGDTITLASGVDVTVGVGGSLTITGDGTNTANDAFTYSITDGNGGTSTAFVDVAITAAVVNSAPVAADDTGSTDEDAILSVIATAGLIDSNDTDPDGDTLVVSAVNGAAGNVGSQFTLASGALLTVNADGSYDYDPNGQFENLNSTQTATDTFSYEVSDGNGGTDTATVSITINGVNDEPSGSDATLATNEDTAHTFSAADFGFSDPAEGDSFQSVTVQPLTGNGTLVFNGTPVTVATVIPVASIGLLVYAPASNDNGNGVASVQFQVTDDGGTANSGQNTDQTPNTITFDVTPVADIPTLNLDPDNDNATPVDGSDDGADDGGFEVTFIENGTPIAFVDSDVSVIDPDDDIVEMTVILTNGQIGDTINFPSSLPGNITAAVAPSSTLVAAGVMTITFTGDASTTNANWTTVLQALTFNPSTNDIHNPNPADRNIDIQLSDASFGFSPVVTATIHVVPENDPPTLDLDDDNSSGINAGNYQGTYVENAVGLAISDGAVITDLDDSNLETITISLTNGEIGDVLQIGALPAGITLVGAAPSNLVAAGTQSITLTGSASLADYQTAIAAITFASNSEDPASGIRNITVTGNDGDDNTPTRTAFITVMPVNDPPVPINPATPNVPPADPNAVIPDQSGQDSSALTPLAAAQFFADPDDTVLTYSLGAGAPVWIAIDPTTGEVTGTPPSDASQNTNNATPGSYDVVIIATDLGGLTGQTTAVFNITNPAPDAIDDTLAVNEDAANLTGSVFDPNGTATGDSDPDGDTIVVSQVAGAPAGVGNAAAGSNGGLFTINADGTYTFDQNGEFNDLAVGETQITTITYEISDGQGGTDTATISLTVTGTNDAPTAVADNATTDEDTAISITAALGLITPNDTDPDASDTLIVSAVNGTGPVGTQITLPSGALLTVNANGSYDYDPNGAFENLAVGETGTDSFDYTISDGNGGTASATVTLTIDGVNDAPTAVNDTATTDENTVITTTPATGLIDPNDTDPDGSDVLTVSLVNGLAANVGGAITLPSGATLTVSADGSYIYDPTTAFSNLAVGETGNDSFTYTIDDGNGGTSQATVNLTINGANDAPTAVDDTATTDEDTIITTTAATGLITPNDTDPDAADVLTVSLVNGLAANVGGAITLPSGATLTVSTDGSYDYDPTTAFNNLAAGETGTDSFTYTIDDGNGGTSQATVNLTINGVNDAPTANADVGTTDEDTAFSVTTTNGLIDLNDTDPDTNDTLNVTAVNGAGSVGSQITLPSGALLTVNADGSYDYDPNGQFESLAQGATATDTFSYDISDGNGGTSTASVTITINGVNDVPEIFDPLDPLNPPADPDNVIPDVAYTDGENTVTIDASIYIVDPDSDPLTFSAIGLPPGLAINAVTGEITGTLDPDASIGGMDPVNAPGVYHVVITGLDIHGASISTTVDYTITNVDPIAVDDTATTDEDTIATGNVLTGVGADSDGAPDSDSLQVSEINGVDANVGQPVSGSTGGVFTVDSNGDWSFDPGADFNGLAVGESRDTTITYQVSDGNGGFDEATLSITVDGTNDAPVVGGPLPVQSVTDGETISPIDTTTAFSNPANATLTYGAIGLPVGLSIDPVTGLITGTVDSAASLNGTYPVTVTAMLPGGQIVETMVTIQVSNVDPNAADDAIATTLNTPIIISPLTNDSDGAPDSDPLTISQITVAPANGTAIINADGTIEYTPDPGFSGTDTFIYEVSDGQGGTDTATVTIAVDVPSPDVPVSTPIAPQSFNDGEVIAPLDFSGSFSDPNSDPLTFTATGLPIGLSIDPATGIITGTVDPDASEDGPYSVVVTASDPAGNQTSQPVTINVANPTPVAGDDSVVTTSNTAVDISVLANDSDPDGDALDIALINLQPANGAVIVNPDGTITYTPNLGFTGTDTFTYILEDANGGRDEATVTINVGVPNPDAPTSTPIAPETVDEGAPITPIDVSGSFVDPNGDPLTFTATGLPPGLSIDPVTGLITGTPDNDASVSGPYTVQVTAIDPAGNQITTPIVITVDNPAPVASADTAITATDTPVVIAVMSNDSDPDGDTLSVTSTTPPTNGAITVNPDGTITYTPNAGFTGPDSFTYTITDAQGATSTETVTVTVAATVSIPIVSSPIPAITTNDGATPSTLDVSTVIIDPDGDTLIWSASDLPAGLSINAATGEITGTVNASASQGGPNSDGVYTATISAQDPSGDITTTTVQYTISNLAPIANDDAVTHGEDGASTGSVFVDNGSGIDADTAPDSDPITVSGVGINPGAIPVTGDAGSVGVPVSSPTGGEFTILANGNYSFDPGVDFQDLDVGESRDTSISYQISDGQGGFDTATITVTVTGANDAPVITDPDNPSGIPNDPSVPADPDNIIPDVTSNDSEPLTPVDVSPFFVDVDGEPLTFSIDPAGPAAPPWLVIDPVTGVITGTPPSDASQGGPNSDGVYSIIIKGTDPDGAEVTTTLDFTILNVAPIVTTPLPDITDTASYTVTHPSQPNFNDPDGDILSYSAAGLPLGVTIDPVTGEISGTISPTAYEDALQADGIYVVTITVDDGQGGMVSSSFTYTVLPLPFVSSDTPDTPGDQPKSKTPLGDDDPTNMILTKAINEINPLGPHTGLFNSKHPVTDAINQIDPLGAITRLGDSRHPISDLMNWIDQTRELLNRSDVPGAPNPFGSYVYAGGDAEIQNGSYEVMSRSLVINQMVVIELSGNGYDANDWRIEMKDGRSLPAWMQNIDGRAIIIIRPADLASASFNLVGPDGDLELHVDMVTGQLKLQEAPEKVTSSQLFSDKLIAMRDNNMDQVRYLMNAG